MKYKGYQLDGEFFVVENGRSRYNRPLYGAPGRNLIYSGDRPEWVFLRYGSGKVGHLQIGIVKGRRGKWLVDADHVVARYRPGYYLHEARDALLGAAVLTVQSTARPDVCGLLVKISLKGDAAGARIVWAFGGLPAWEKTVEGDTAAYTPESYFYPRPEDALNNRVRVAANTFGITQPLPVKPSGAKKIQPAPLWRVFGTVTAGTVRSADGRCFQNINEIGGKAGRFPIVAGNLPLKSGAAAMIGLVLTDRRQEPAGAGDLNQALAAALAQHVAVRQRIKVKTPDQDLNALAPALCASMEANWDPPHIMHGAIHCHGAFMGWRGPYGPIALGQFDRAESHFRAFTVHQLKRTPRGNEKPKMDPAYGLARPSAQSVLCSKGRMPQELWSGGIGYSGPFNMQEGFVDQILQCYQYTGDQRFIRGLFAVIERHLGWEKRCFDPDRDGLYENLANIHISDAVQYNGAGCAVASAYNYRANRAMAAIARRLGKDPAPFAKEARAIKRAMNRWLWLADKGVFAECRDYLGLRQVHTSAALPSIYHVIESGLPDMFQRRQMLSYVTHALEHVRCGHDRGWLVSNSNWVPWFWSVRQLMSNETWHAALAAWQSGRKDQAYAYFIGPLLNTMLENRFPAVVVACPDLDKHLSSASTDFADSVACALRALVEGLFGIRMNMPAGKVVIRPGFPDAWPEASIETPYLKYDYHRQATGVSVVVELARPARLVLELPNPRAGVPQATVNGRPAETILRSEIDACMATFTTLPGTHFEFRIAFRGNRLGTPECPRVLAVGRPLKLGGAGLKVLGIRDPQKCFAKTAVVAGTARLTLRSQTVSNQDRGHGVFFADLAQGACRWWQSFDIEIRPALELVEAEYCALANAVHCRVRNNLPRAVSGRATLMVPSLEHAVAAKLALKAGAIGERIAVALPAGRAPGTYALRLTAATNIGAQRHTTQTAVWDAVAPPLAAERFVAVDISARFNADAADIFKQKYLKPRSPFCSLQIPDTGYGEWCYGIKRKPPELSTYTYRHRKTGSTKLFVTRQGIPFHNPVETGANIIYTSRWDNFPTRVEITIEPVAAARAYFLVAGSANPMYAQLDNALLTVRLAGGLEKRLPIRNPSNFWPIFGDPDLDADGFCLPKPYPQRVSLDNSVGSDNTWANLLDLELNGAVVEGITFECLSNETVIGLMGVTFLMIS